MESMNFVENLFNYLTIVLFPIYLFATFIAIKFHKNLTKSLSFFWILSLIIPPLTPLAVIDTGGRAKQFFKKKKVKIQSDFGFILAMFSFLSFAIFISGSIYFFNIDNPSMQDFNILAMSCTASILMQIIASISGIYCYHSLNKTLIEWKENRQKSPI